MRFAGLRALVASRKDATMAPVKFEVRRDEEAGVWYAVATDDSGIVTEAETIEALHERLKQLVPDFLELDCDCPIELEMCSDELAFGCCELPPR
ncbi:hypothetical protein AXW83_16230 [Bosea sp. PAMC 26642]|nr:hypothetical protein AXW83_16230 [Bosea sp. PAMC 26642]